MDRSWRIARLWLIGDLALIIVSVLVYATSPRSVEQIRPTFLQDLFFIDYDANVSNWYSSLQLAFVGWIWLRVAQAARNGINPDRRLALAAMLIFGAAMFGSLDEVAQVHEKIGTYTQDPLLPRTGYWIFIYLPVLFALAVAVLALIGRQLWAHRRALAWIVAGGALYVVSAGWLEIILNFIPTGGAAELIELHIEESGELIGVWMILWGSLQMRDALTGVPQTGGGQLASS